MPRTFRYVFLTGVKISSMRVINLKSRHLPTGEQLTDPNLNVLIERLQQNTISILLDDDVPLGGLHHHFAQGKLFLNPRVIEESQLGQALVVYAEFQHDSSAPEYYPSDNDEVQIAFDRVRSVLTTGERTGFINSLSHGGHR